MRLLKTRDLAAELEYRAEQGIGEGVRLVPSSIVYSNAIESTGRRM